MIIYKSPGPYKHQNRWAGQSLIPIRRVDRASESTSRFVIYFRISKREEKQLTGLNSGVICPPFLVAVERLPESLS